jgi:competence protein ComEC
VSDVRTLERDRQETTEPAVEPTDRLPVATVPATRKAARRTLTASAAAALDGRRLFVLLPFGMVAGAAIYAGAGAEPQAFVLPGLAIASAAALWLSRNSLAAVRVVMLAVSLAAGFAVMMAHSLLFGTPMLGEPRYGVYEATIAAVLSEGEGGGRIVLSDIVPTGTARPLGIFLARISVPDALSLNRGDRIRAAIRFAPIPAPVFPGGLIPPSTPISAASGPSATPPAPSRCWPRPPSPRHSALSRICGAASPSAWRQAWRSPPQASPPPW